MTLIFYPTPCRFLSSRNQATTNIDKDAGVWGRRMGREEHLHIVGGSIN
jgi:hypothetical protein